MPLLLKAFPKGKASLLAFFLLLAGNGYAASGASAPDAKEALLLLRSTLIAIDHGNDTLNYSVLRDMAAPEFQARYSLAAIESIFSEVRAAGLDLQDTLIKAPAYHIGPMILDNGQLRMRGRFLTSPEPLNFDVLFRRIYGKWRLLDIALLPGDPG